jgi:hypothetical protein
MDGETGKLYEYLDLFVEDYSDFWEEVSRNSDILTDSFVKYFHHKLDLFSVIKHSKLSEGTLEDIMRYVTFLNKRGEKAKKYLVKLLMTIYYYQKVSDEFEKSYEYLLEND